MLGSGTRLRSGPIICLGGADRRLTHRKRAFNRAIAANHVCDLTQDFHKFLMLVVPPEYLRPRTGEHHILAQRRDSFVKCRQSTEFIIHAFVENHGARDVALDRKRTELQFLRQQRHALVALGCIRGVQFITAGFRRARST